MASPADVPRIAEPIAGNGGHVTGAWLDFFLKLASAQTEQNLAELYAQLAARVAQLEDGQSLSFQLLGQGSIGVQGIPQPGGAVIITLQNDSNAPGNTMYYGTGPTGAKGWFAISSAIAGTTNQITKTTGTDGVVVLALAPSVLVSLGLADTALQDVIAGTNVTIDKTDPRRPIISATGGGGDNPLFPQLTDQLGNLLTDQLGQPLRQNTPAVPWSWLYNVPDYQPLDSDLTAIAALTGAGVPLRATAGTWSLATLNALTPMTLAAANALTGVADFQMVAITDLAGGREPCWYDSTVASGTKWRRFSDRSIAN